MRYACSLNSRRLRSLSRLSYSFGWHGGGTKILHGTISERGTCRAWAYVFSVDRRKKEIYILYLDARWLFRYGTRSPVRSLSLIQIMYRLIPAFYGGAGNENHGGLSLCCHSGISDDMGTLLFLMGPLSMLIEF